MQDFLFNTHPKLKMGLWRVDMQWYFYLQDFLNGGAEIDSITAWQDGEIKKQLNTGFKGML